ncbi:hypothetical protein E2C01_087551 [Portunus trituberculatus]|uniref:Uncharacterized protein n=1 Tax=Portunus trituberculatus TaxID=210409 RepID=A0A5B7J6V7_PORTR|nr:hypothetical protein [Portunus trituberculatus]
MHPSAAQAPPCSTGGGLSTLPAGTSSPPHQTTPAGLPAGFYCDSSYYST